MFKILIILLLLPIHVFSMGGHTFNKVDFDESMGKVKSKFAKERFALYFKKDQSYSQHKFDIFKKLYEKKAHISNAPKIPKIIHQIWLGPKEIPAKYLKYSQTWQQKHPTWKYKLWRDDDIDKLNLVNRDLYDNATTYQERADIARYEILYRFGGLYVDFDYVALKNFDDLHHSYEFYGSLEPSHKYHQDIVMTNAIIATKPNHAVFQNIFNKIRNKWNDTQKQYDAGKIKGNKIAIAIHRCMLPLTETVIEHVDKNIDENIVILPPTYLMPIYPAGQLGSGGLYGKIMRFLKLQKDDGLFRRIMPESMAYQDFNDDGVVLSPHH